MGSPLGISGCGVSSPYCTVLFGVAEPYSDDWGYFTLLSRTSGV